MTWHHAPQHEFDYKGSYMVTGATYQKELFFRSDDRLTALQLFLLDFAAKFGWRLDAWAVFPNHYHFIGSPRKGAADKLAEFLGKFHAYAARYVNEADQTPGRQVFYNFWETALHRPERYFPRLRYVIENPVRHGLVDDPSQYRFCSSGRHPDRFNASLLRKLDSFKIDRLEIYEP